MAQDPLTEADNDMTEQARWGLSLRDRALLRAVAALKAVVVRLKQLEDRVQRLEGK